MKRYWSVEELEDFWKLLPEEKVLLGKKHGVQKFLYLLFLKYYSIDYQFPECSDDIPKTLINFGLRQYGITLDTNDIIEFLNARHNYIKYQKEIRSFYGACLFSAADQQMIVGHVYKLALEMVKEDKLTAELLLLLKRLKIEKPNKNIIQDLIKQSLIAVETYLFNYIYQSLTTDQHNYIDHNLLGLEPTTEEMLITYLKQDSGKSNRDAIAVELDKLNVLQGLKLTTTIIPADISPAVLKFYRRKVISDTPHQLKNRPKQIRYALIIVFCYLKQQELFDNLADHLINVIHKIKKKADKTEFALNNEIGKLSRGLDSLYLIAEVARDIPKGIIQETIYPLVPKAQLEAIIKARYLQKNLTNSVRDKAIQSYTTHYRKKIFDIINILPLKSNNKEIISVLALIKKYQYKKSEFYPITEDIPLNGLINKADLEFICSSNEAGNKLVSRKDYEYSIFKILRDKLKHKEVWIDGAFKYKDPATELPKYFIKNKEFYYQLLGQPLIAQEFINVLKAKLMEAIQAFDKNLPKNKYVRIIKRRGKPWIKLSPLPERIKPHNLQQLKDSINHKWGIINLLDVLKETDLREHFTSCFTSSGNREILSQEEIQKRLIMCLYAIGTNTGLHRISSASTNNITLEDLKYIKRKYINQEDLREAITKIVNAIFKIRNPDIWGESTTACAADSRKFTSWDQNLMTEWHARYKGAGVMIYWHVTNQSICIHSQLKTCSSSEVASMLQGVLSHGTDIEIESQYVDSHGKSELGFALTYLLGFDLLPRYAEISSQKIYLPEPEFNCKNINEIMTRVINWDLIIEHYDTLIQYTVALKIGTATADSIIRQFSRTNFQHPVFKAFIELGRAVKSIFLCRYLLSLDLRQEIHTGLNIVENWNSVNDFIFYGKKSEINSNSRDEQEYSVLSLHLTYVNILLVQDIINTESWLTKLTVEDKRGITPLFSGRINPYGTFELDMSKRILLKEVA